MVSALASSPSPSAWLCPLPHGLAGFSSRLMSLSEEVATGMRTQCCMIATGHNGQENCKGSLGGGEAEVPGGMQVGFCSGGGWGRRGHGSRWPLHLSSQTSVWSWTGGAHAKALRSVHIPLHGGFQGKGLWGVRRGGTLRGIVRLVQQSGTMT